LEEIVTYAINNSPDRPYDADWAGMNHGKEHDIKLTWKNGIQGLPLLQVKSGVLPARETAKSRLTLSGPRLTRFNGGLEAITEYLTDMKDVQYLSIASPQARRPITKFMYTPLYIPLGILTDVTESAWRQTGKEKKDWIQTTPSGVVVTIVHKTSDQVWWKIPTRLITEDCREKTIVIIP
jgi:hypothetical protein